MNFKYYVLIKRKYKSEDCKKDMVWGRGRGSRGIRGRREGGKRREEERLS